MSTRKPYNNCAGYRCSRRSGANRGWIVVYEAKDAHLDVGGDRYAVSCETHNTLTGATSMPQARKTMKWPEFCEACMKVLDPHPDREPPTVPVNTMEKT